MRKIKKTPFIPWIDPIIYCGLAGIWEYPVIQSKFEWSCFCISDHAAFGGSVRYYTWLLLLLLLLEELYQAIGNGITKNIIPFFRKVYVIAYVESKLVSLVPGIIRRT